jgi:holo-[acyl-carrier protein] synthase
VAVGLGIDLVDVARFASVLLRRPSIAERLFTRAERSYAATLANPVPSLAARFAAKEAVMKPSPTSKCSANLAANLAWC